MRTRVDEKPVGEVLDQLVEHSRQDELDQLAEQFAAKLTELESEKKATAEMIEQLWLRWKLLEVPDDVVPFKAKALVMAAMSGGGHGAQHECN